MFAGTVLEAGVAFAAGLSAGEEMPVTRRNALMKTYCAVCHTDGE